MVVYVGARYQRGHGLGSIFRSIARIAMPMIKRVGKSAVKAVGREVAKSGSSFISDVMKGVPVKKAAKSRSRQGLQNVMKKGQRMVMGAAGYNPPGEQTTKKRKRKNTPAKAGGKRVRRDVFN